MGSTMVSSIMFVLNLVAFILAIEAELNRSTAKVVVDSEANYCYCLYGSNIATKLGMGASLLLMASHILFMAKTGFFFLDKALNSKVSRAWTITLFVGSWITFSATEVCLVWGSLINAQHTRYRTIFGDEPPSCQTLREGVFAAGAAFTLLTSICTQCYHRYFAKAVTELSSDQFITEPMIVTVAEVAEQA